MTPAEAKRQILAHDAAARHYNRKTRTELHGIWKRGPGRQSIYGGPHSKDELINALVDAEFPSALMDEARQVYYAAQASA